MKSILIFLLLASTAYSGTILQEQSMFAGIINGTNYKGQTFLAEDPLLKSIGVSLQVFPGPSSTDRTVNMFLYEGRGTDGSLLAQRSMTTAVGRWMNFDVVGVAVVPGQTYTFVIQSPARYWGADYNQWATEPDGYVDPDIHADRVDYPGGEMITSRGFHRYLDLAFRVEPIPEPGIVALLLTGLAGLWFWRCKLPSQHHHRL